ncbi:aminomethyl-transferring glycine dehydrogenase subunit GcvPA [Thermoleophilum album]|uniref:aminomethyl-transferring glycine dehydrogenase subunit GcvPA n=1 Tax=Thermoleophilum album TaxID=29539 RepID=UPI00237D2C00|nr:aminomethyl-transferring glycine dehydrogenase subunit GcvPA [Thermoleophilum album]MCL6440658.1 aminomethyl-transferring glycine dehydrogenase subunit GcvPA [Thermoleophilum sp.]WDT94377.1 aminomethyl-transferring glycine dehydrogenase subunit GcvPA [Thermoleophilum album]
MTSVRYTSLAAEERQRMLARLGVSSIEELVAGEIPEGVRLRRPLDIAPGLSEQEVYDELRCLAERNGDADTWTVFAGAGMYDHYVPAVVDEIVRRSEFLTPYTPYQPEVSQGTLQAMFEFQTAICELTGLEVANAAVYDGASAVAAAAYLAKLDNRRSRVVVSRGVHPHARAALATHAHGFRMTVEEVPLAADGTTDRAALAAAVDDDTACVVVQQPNFLGSVEDLAALAEPGRERKAAIVCVADPLTLGVLEAPGRLGADICVGEGQALGNHLQFGGPSFGFFAARERYLRRMPGRIAGRTRDVDGRPGYVLTLQTREQHIRRERATHNICTAQQLNALAGLVYLSWLGRRGIVELGELLVRRTHYARERLGLEAINPGPVVREFAVRVPDLDGLFERALAERIIPGVRLGRFYPEYPDGLLVAITERRSRSDIERLAHIVAEVRELAPAAAPAREEAPA